MTTPNAPQTPRAEENALLAVIPESVRLLCEMGDCLVRRLGASPKARTLLTSEVAQVFARLKVVALPDKSTPAEVQLFTGCFGGNEADIYATRLLAVLLKTALVNASGIYFETLAKAVQMGHPSAFLPVMATIAEIKVAGFVTDEKGWLQLAPQFLEAIFPAPHWLADQRAALIRHGHEVSDDSML